VKVQYKYFSLSLLILLSSFILIGILELKQGWAQSVIKTIDVVPYPYNMEYNPDNGYIYVANYPSGAVSVIDSATNSVIKTIDVGNGPWDLEYNPSNNAIYIVNHEIDDVSVISGYTNKVIKTIAVGDGPTYLEYNPSNKYIYTANMYSDDVSVIGSYTIIIGPAANAGPNLIADSNTRVQLDGGGSSADSNSSEENLTYKWTQTSGGSVHLTINL
jgi:YVTN family beta-propeller protein